MTNPNTKFTLIEMVLMAAILAILAGIITVAVNPSQQLVQAQNEERKADMSTILNAVYQYALDNEGNVPASITQSDTEICATDASDCIGLVDLSVLTDNEEYLIAIPEDPDNTTSNGTGYNIMENPDGQLTVSAPNTEKGETISITR